MDDAPAVADGAIQEQAAIPNAGALIPDGKTQSQQQAGGGAGKKKKKGKR